MFLSSLRPLMIPPLIRCRENHQMKILCHFTSQEEDSEKEKMKGSTSSGRIIERNKKEMRVKDSILLRVDEEGGIKGAVTVLLLKHLMLLLKQAVISKAIKVNPVGR